MRITGGEWAGQRLGVPRGAVRPTSDRVRESVFAILGDLEGARVLDLCAGSGALGLEALSRGAERAVFVDRSGPAVAQVRENAATVGAADRVATVRADVLVAVERAEDRGEVFDLVLLDPPYAAGLADPVLAVLGGAGALAPHARVVVETDRRHPPGEPEGLRRTRERRYGDTLVTFYVSTATPRGPRREESIRHE